jgi:hypothetical protein
MAINSDEASKCLLGDIKTGVPLLLRDQFGGNPEARPGRR